jgi:hypothetical protein
MKFPSYVKVEYLILICPTNGRNFGRVAYHNSEARCHLHTTIPQFVTNKTTPNTD